MVGDRKGFLRRLRVLRAKGHAPRKARDYDDNCPKKPVVRIGRKT